MEIHNSSSLHKRRSSSSASRSPCCCRPAILLPAAFLSLAVCLLAGLAAFRWLQPTAEPDLGQEGPRGPGGPPKVLDNKSALPAFLMNQHPTNGKPPVFFEEVMMFDEKKMEDVHDFIQWLFPSDQASVHNTGAGTLTQSDINFIKGDELCQENLLRAYVKFLTFLGFEMDGSHIVSPKSQRKRMCWTKHNNARISRVLHSLDTLGRTDLAAKLFAALMELHHAGQLPKHVKENVIVHWERAFPDIREG